MDFLINNWLLIVIAIAAFTVGGYSFFAFINRPTNEQLSKVKEWLLASIAEAEKELGSGTGQIKLRYVYDLFIMRFPHLAKVVSFEHFSIMVDEVLDKFKTMLDSNEKLKTYIEQ